MSQGKQHLSVMLRHLCRSLATPRELPDRQLLERFLLFREQTAFELLVRRHGPLVLGVCRRVLGNEQDAEDAFQATFLLLARKANAIHRRESVGSWLYGVAYRTALKLRARTARRQQWERAAARPNLAENGRPVAEVEALLDEEVQRLPAKYRIPIVLCYLEGRTHAEAAVELGWPIGTVAGRLARAREMLRERLTRRGVTIAATTLAITLAAQPASAAPLTLMHSTVEAALALATGKTVLGVASSQALALTEGMVKAMFMSKMQIVATAVFAFAVLGTGLGVGTYQVLALAQDDAKSAPATAATQIGQAPVDKPRIAVAEDVMSELVTLRGHTDEVHCVAFAPDGKRIISAGADGTVRIWDVASGKEIRALQQRKEMEAIWSAAFTPDGKLVAAGDDNGSVRLWDAATGQAVRELDGQRPVRSVAFSPDGRLLASASDDRTIRLWEAASGKMIRVVEGSPATGKLRGAQVVFAPDGRTLAASSVEKGVVLVDVAKGRVLFSFAGGDDEAGVAAIAFSPDAKLVAAGGHDRWVHFLDAASGKEIRRIANTSAVLSLAISPDGKTLATASSDGSIRIWDIASGKEVANFKIHDHKSLASVTFAPDGSKLAAADGDKSVKVWRVENRFHRYEKADATDIGKLLTKVNSQAADGDRLDQLVTDLVKSQRSDQQVIDAVFLATLGRFPEDREKSFVSEHLKSGKDRREAIADIVWSLTNSLEFGKHVQELNKRTKPRQ